MLSRTALRLKRCMPFGLARAGSNPAAVVPVAIARTRFSTFPSLQTTDAADNRPKIYTKTGDKGTSSLFTGERRPKDHVVFDALGTNDELSSSIGMAREYCLDQNTSSATQQLDALIQQLEQIQCLLQDIGSNIATPRDSTEMTEARRKLTEFDADGHHVQDLETWIDAMDKELPPLTSFILPSGGKAAASLHVARGVSRRTERRVVPLAQAEMVDKSVAIYLNRLSDYLFTCARFAAHQLGRKEVLYKKARVKRSRKIAVPKANIPETA